MISLKVHWLGIAGIRIIVKTPPGFSAVPPSQYHAFQKWRRSKTLFLEFIKHNLRDVISRVEPHKIQQSEGAHRITAIQLHRNIDIHDGPDAFFQRADRVE